MKGITDSFPSVVGKYKIIVLNSDEKQKILKANGKVYIYRFLPFVFKDGVFKVELSGFSCKLDGSAVVNAGYRYSFIYDYQKNRFVFSKFEGGGI
jgi:hypothetical protein